MSNISALTNVSSDYIQQALKGTKASKTETDSFDFAMNTAMSMVQEMNDTQKDYESAEIQFALGEAENTHDLQIAQSKANTTLQYTVAVRDKLMSAYKEIMNMQI